MRLEDLKGINLPEGSKNSPASVYTASRGYSLFWDVIAPKGAKLSVLQDHDVIFDKYDLKIRKLI